MKIYFIFSNRAEFSLLSPFIKYFKTKCTIKSIDFSKKINNLDLDKNLSKVYDICFSILSKQKVDYVIILGDRRETPLIAYAAFMLNIKIIHVAAGEFVPRVTSYDQYLRPIVSILSFAQIVFSNKAKNEVQKLFNGLSNFKANVHILGNPVFKGIDIINLSRTFSENYDLVLLHPQSLSKKNTQDDIQFLKKYLKNKKTIFIYGNHDRNFDLIEQFYKKLKKKSNYLFFENMPKEKYFSLVKYCDTFYTNSSSISEIEYITKSIKTIGKRNRNRSKMIIDDKSPEKLYQLLEKNQKK